MLDYPQKGSDRTVKLYLAGPMSGKAGFNYPRFQEVAEALRSRHYDIVSPHEMHDGDTSQSWEWYLRKDLTIMLECDGLILLEDWEESRGARLELFVADKTSMFVYTLDKDLNLQASIYGSQDRTGGIL